MCKQHDAEMLVAEQAQRGEELLEVVLEEIADDDQHPALAQPREQVAQRGRQRGVRRRLGLFQRVDDDFELRVGRGGRVERVELRRDQRQAEAVAFLDDQVRHGGGEVARVVELRAVGAAAEPRAESHRAAHVKHERRDEVRLVLVLADVRPPGATEHLPVEPPDIVAGAVLAMLEKFRRAALVPRAMPAGVRPFHGVPRAEPQVAQPVQRADLQEPALRRNGRHSASPPQRARRIGALRGCPGAYSGTCSSNCRMISVVSTASPTAW